MWTNIFVPSISKTILPTPSSTTTITSVSSSQQSNTSSNNVPIVIGIAIGIGTFIIGIACAIRNSSYAKY